MAAQLKQELNYLEDVLLFIILSKQNLVHNRRLPLGTLVGHGGGLVQVVRQAVPCPHGQHILGVGGAHFVDEDLTILNGLAHRTQAVRVQQLVLGHLLRSNTYKASLIWLKLCGLWLTVSRVQAATAAAAGTQPLVQP